MKEETTMKYIVSSGVLLVWGLTLGAAGIDNVNALPVVSAQALLDAYVPPMLSNAALAEKFKSKLGDESLFTHTCLGVVKKDSRMSLVDEAANTRAEILCEGAQPRSYAKIKENLQAKIPRIRGALLEHDANALAMLSLCHVPYELHNSGNGQR